MSNQIVRYKKGKAFFEINTKPGSVRLFLSGKLGWDKVLAVDAIFTNLKKGNVAKSSELKTIFGTDDINKCAEIIVREGDVQVSAQERKADIETHRNQVLSYMHRSYVDQNGGAYPLARLELILEEAKVQINPASSIHKTTEEIIKKMMGKAVFKRNSVDYTISVPKQYRKEVNAVVCKFSPNMHKEIRGKEEIIWKISIVIPDMDAFTIEMNKITSGDFKVVGGHENT